MEPMEPMEPMEGYNYEGVKDLINQPTFNLRDKPTFTWYLVDNKINLIHLEIY